MYGNNAALKNHKLLLRKHVMCFEKHDQTSLTKEVRWFLQRMHLPLLLGRIAALSNSECVGASVDAVVDKDCRS